MTKGKLLKYILIVQIVVSLGASLLFSLKSSPSVAGRKKAAQLRLN